MAVMPSSLSSRSRSAAEAAVIAARSGTAGGVAGACVCAAMAVIRVREAPDARNRLASLNRVPELIFPHALDGHFNHFRTDESRKSSGLGHNDITHNSPQATSSGSAAEGRLS